MVKYICVAENESDAGMEIPVSEQGTITLSTLTAQFHGACGIKYRSETGNFRAVPVVDDNLQPPKDETIVKFVVVFPKEKPVKEVVSSSNSDVCTDLIVLGLPWKCSVEQMRTYFSEFGKISSAEVKMDSTGKSRGYGFIRFVDIKVQLRCLTQRHLIEEKWCDVKIPNSSVNGEAYAEQFSSRIFVGNITQAVTSDAIHVHFSTYGEVIDVYYPKPFRAFAFVTFKNAEIARSLIGEDHVITGHSCKVSAASPKNRIQAGGMDQQNGGHGNNFQRLDNNRGYGDCMMRDNKRPRYPDNGPIPIVHASMMNASQANVSPAHGWSMLNISQGLDHQSPPHKYGMHPEHRGFPHSRSEHPMYPREGAPYHDHVASGYQGRGDHFHHQQAPLPHHEQQQHHHDQQGYPQHPAPPPPPPQPDHSGYGPEHGVYPGQDPYRLAYAAQNIYNQYPNGSGYFPDPSLEMNQAKQAPYGEMTPPTKL